MSNPHHHHLNRNHCNSFSCNSTFGNCTCCSPPTSTTTSDQLLQSILTHLLLQSQSGPPRQPLYPYDHLSPQYQQTQSHVQMHNLIQSLARRVTALESYISHLSSAFPSPSPFSLQGTTPSLRDFAPILREKAPSLRDLAARKIQYRFRLYLVRRSRKLWQLKQLAVIRSCVAELRCEISDKGREKKETNPADISEKAMDLLLRLDSIQSADPMISDGKRSISRELTRILDFIDRVLLRDFGKEKTEELPYSKTKKKVGFSENAHHKSQLSEDEESSESSSSGSESEKMKMGLSAPLPVQMEARRVVGQTKR